MTRRLHADGNVANRRTLLTLTILLLAWLVDAQPQHQQPKSSRIRDYVPPQDGISVGSISTLEATTLARARQPVDVVRDENYKHNGGYHGADAEMTALPRKTVDVKAVIPAVRAPTSRRSGILGNADLTLQNARSLDDWEVEDFVLMADVEGRVFARDRKTGKHRWVLDIDRPIVEAEYQEQERNLTGKEQRAPVDESVWMVEPSGDGPLYIYVPGGPQTGLLNTGLSMKKLVEMAPHSEGDFVFVGEKQTELLTVSAFDGSILQWFGTKTKYNRAAPTCGPKDGFDIPDNDEECTETGTITLGRTQYTVEIQRSDGHPVVTLKYAEWGPNNFNKDLLSQHKGSMDGKYWYSRHDGSVFAFSPERNDGRRNPLLYNARMESPIVRIFDVARPMDESATPELIVLPQPPAPPAWDQMEGDTERRNTRVFVNKTKLDQLYVLSGKTYPLVVDGPKHAECDHEDFWQWLTPDSQISQKRLKEALVGLHSVDGERPKPLLTIGAPPNDFASSEVKNDEPVNPTIPILEPVESVIQRARALPAKATNSASEWVSNPITMGLSIALFIWWVYQKRRIIRDTIMKNVYISDFINMITKWSLKPKKSERESIAHAVEEKPQSVTEPLPLDNPNEVVDETPVPKLPSLDGANDESEQEVEVEKLVGNGVARESIAETPVKSTEAPETTPSPPPKVLSERTNTEGNRKRGKRGGKNKNKNKNKSDSQSSDPSKMGEEPETVEGAIAHARRLVEPKPMEPDLITIPTAVSEITGPILRINNLEVNTEKLIGTGSNGTMVFEGKLGGRVVAVKRMLIQFFEIASHETRLLEESDIHPNVVRYYVQQQSQGFLYIALELCSASLADVIERPLKHLQLAQRGEKNTPNILYQITNGLRHLHNLRIVHRDLKPQNILVSMGADGNPRMLVSDFGLCKKLEGEQSSFRATTAHAAGTSGWRAPELLLDDDARHDKPPGYQEPSSHMSETGSGPLVSTDLLPTRRATRAIDIFSLGLVFFYVLTRGLHPYDCGDRFMREVNIRKGVFKLDQLDALGDDSFEAKDLISAMLRHEPKMRPTAQEVMAHPFFWSRERRLEFLCDVSDYFEKECRDPPSLPLQILERHAGDVTNGDFLKYLGKEFLDSLGKQRKYTGSRMLDLLRALRNKKYHYEDMSDSLKAKIGKLPEGYLSFWTQKFPNLIITCWEVVREAEWENTDRFKKYYQPLPPM